MSKAILSEVFKGIISEYGNMLKRLYLNGYIKMNTMKTKVK